MCKHFLKNISQDVESFVLETTRFYEHSWAMRLQEASQQHQATGPGSPGDTDLPLARLG